MQQAPLKEQPSSYGLFFGGYPRPSDDFIKILGKGTRKKTGAIMN
jgi:hypothetical protein